MAQENGTSAGEHGNHDLDSWGPRMVDEQTQDPEELRVFYSAVESFAEYARVAHFNVTHLRRQSFYALPQAHWKLLAAPPFNYLETLEKVDEAIDCNAELGRHIVETALTSFGKTEIPASFIGIAKHGDIDKARSTIRQFWRDWSSAGAAEREACYGPVLTAMQEERAKQSNGAEPLSVLVPGAGLGRLVFELCKRGFDAEGNEISYHQLIASQYIINNCAAANKHTIFPWINSFSNHLTRQNHLRSYTVPDVHPPTVLTETPGARPMAMCAADFLCGYGEESHVETYDAVAAVFFLDTAPNLIRYLDVIWSCLKFGGVLINVGPLLWHFENNAPGNNGHDDDGDGKHDWKQSSGIADPGSYELSEDEVLALLEKMGFSVEWKETGIETPYIQDQDSMLRTTYKSSAWVARKIERPQAAPA